MDKKALLRAYNSGFAAGKKAAIGEAIDEDFKIICAGFVFALTQDGFDADHISDILGKVNEWFVAHNGMKGDELLAKLEEESGVEINLTEGEGDEGVHSV